MADALESGGDIGAEPEGDIGGEPGGVRYGEPGGECPLLEYDPDPRDVVSAGEAGADRVKVPEKGLLAFLGGHLAEYLQGREVTQIACLETVTGEHPVHRVEEGGVEILAVALPLGAPAAVQIADHLFARGLRWAVAVGSCGALVDLPVGTVVVPSAALRDEGTSYHYLPPARWVGTSEPVRRACLAAAAARGRPALTGPTWTTDGFYRETPGKVRRRREEGCLTVEMECAALAACASFRGVHFAQILYAADSLAGDGHEERDWGTSMRPEALTIALDALARL